MPLMPLDQVYGKHTYCLTLHAWGGGVLN